MNIEILCFRFAIFWWQTELINLEHNWLHKFAHRTYNYYKSGNFNILFNILLNMNFATDGRKYYDYDTFATKNKCYSF